MAYEVLIAPAAERDIRRLPRVAARRVARKIRALADDPRPRGAQPVRGGEDLLRVRVGDYRVVYQIADDVLIVLVVRVRHRREVYRH